MLAMPGMVGIDHRGQGKHLVGETLQREARNPVAHMAVDHFGLYRKNSTQHGHTRSLRQCLLWTRPSRTTQRPRLRINGEWLSKRYATRKGGLHEPRKALPERTLFA